MAAATRAAPYSTYAGDYNRSLPYRSTTGSGRPDAVRMKEGLKHKCIYFSDIDNGSTFTYGRPVISAALVLSSANVASIDWDPDDTTGVVTFTTVLANQTGWLHIWSND